MDTFIEQIVQKKKGAKEWATILGVILLGLVLLLVIWLFVPFLALFALMGVGFGAWWLITNQNNEFEYCVTNGDIDVDQIIARRKRKRLVSVAGRKVESLLPYDAAKPQTGYQRVVMVAPSLMESGLWSFTYHSKKNGHTLVIFQPDQRVLQALYSGLPKLVRMDTDRAARERGITLTVPRRHGMDEE